MQDSESNDQEISVDQTRADGSVAAGPTVVSENAGREEVTSTTAGQPNLTQMVETYWPWELPVLLFLAWGCVRLFRRGSSSGQQKTFHSQTPVDALMETDEPSDADVDVNLKGRFKKTDRFRDSKAKNATADNSDGLTSVRQLNKNALTSDGARADGVDSGLNGNDVPLGDLRGDAGPIAAAEKTAAAQNRFREAGSSPDLSGDEELPFEKDQFAEFNEQDSQLSLIDSDAEFGFDIDDDDDFLSDEQVSVVGDGTRAAPAVLMGEIVGAESDIFDADDSGRLSGSSVFADSDVMDAGARAQPPTGTAELDRLGQENFALTETNSSLRKENIALNEKNSQLNQENLRLTENESALNDQNLSLNEKIATLTDENKTLAADLKSIKQQLTDKTRSTDQEQTTLKELTKKSENLAAQLQESNLKREALLAERDQLANKLDLTADHQVQITELENELKSQVDSLAKQQESSQRWGSEKEELQAKLDELSEQNAHWVEQQQSWEQQDARRLAERTEWETERTQLLARQAQWESEREKWATEKQALSDQAESLRAQAADARQAAQEASPGATAEIKELKSRFKLLAAQERRKRITAENHLTEAEAHRTELAKKLKAIKNEITDLKR